MRKIFILSLMAGLLAASCTKAPTTITPAPTPTPVSQVPEASPTPQQANNASKLHPPINNPLARVTKKPFGIYITPASSPVQPEKFSGYHTGVDFEAFDNEQKTDVPIFAACDGKLLLKKYATGYGGVVVQSCVLDGDPVTIIYGHLRLTSIAQKVGDQLKAGDQIGVLGTGYSTETDNERKHLHLGIHKGTAITILGYTQKKSDLTNWLDATQFLK